VVVVKGPLRNLARYEQKYHGRHVISQAIDDIIHALIQAPCQECHDRGEDNNQREEGKDCSGAGSDDVPVCLLEAIIGC